MNLFFFIFWGDWVGKIFLLFDKLFIFFFIKLVVYCVIEFFFELKDVDYGIRGLWGFVLRWYVCYFYYYMSLVFCNCFLCLFLNWVISLYLIRFILYVSRGKSVGLVRSLVVWLVNGLFFLFVLYEDGMLRFWDLFYCYCVLNYLFFMEWEFEGRFIFLLFVLSF